MTYNIKITPDAMEDIADMSKRFGKDFNQQLLKTLLNLSRDLTHPGLQVHSLQGWPEWKECYVNKAHRVVFKLMGNTIVIAWCGDHDDLDRQAFGTGVQNADSGVIQDT